MGQSTSDAHERVEFDENDSNGMILGNSYIPVEVLDQLLINYIDAKSLLTCQLVCRRWNDFIVDYVWRHKAELKTRHKFSEEDPLDWKDYYLICAKNLFERNLLKNHSGREALRHWEIVCQGGDNWRVECPPSGTPPVPEEPGFEDTQHCFVASYNKCTKRQVVDLFEEGFSRSILDLEPVIEVSEWYSARWDCPALYMCTIKLMNENGEIIDLIEWKDLMENNRQNVWYKKLHEFKKYGKGLRYVSFSHSGIDKLFWAGHYGPKMAKASVKVKI